MLGQNPRTPGGRRDGTLSPAATIIASTAGVVGLMFVILGNAPERWATRTPDNLHAYAIRYKGGIDWFFTNRVGWFVDHALWIFFALLGALAIEHRFSRQRGKD